MPTETPPSQRAHAEALEGLSFSDDELKAFEAAAKAAHMTVQDWIYTRLKACLAGEQKNAQKPGEKQT